MKTCQHCGKDLDEKPAKKAYAFEAKAKTGQTLRFASDADRKEYERRAKA